MASRRLELLAPPAKRFWHRPKARWRYMLSQEVAISRASGRRAPVC